ncbi:MAG: hypothetical protein K2K02_11495 [Ruminococcus sp.]|nr:hypothetical protein [Ruminococcus sp.]
MDIDEIKRYIHVGHGYVEVSRDYMYNGFCRRTFIREKEIQIDFCTAYDIELNEGETTFYFGYENFEDVIKSAEKFLKSSVSEWTNYNRTWNEWYFPENPDKNAYINLMKDLQDRKLIFPENFSYMRICDIYAFGIFIGKINPDNFDIDRNMIEYLYKSNHDFTEY